MKILNEKKGIVRIAPPEAVILCMGLVKASGLYETWIKKAKKNSHLYKLGVECAYSCKNMFIELEALSFGQIPGDEKGEELWEKLKAR